MTHLPVTSLRAGRGTPRRPRVWLRWTLWRIGWRNFLPHGTAPWSRMLGPRPRTTSGRRSPRRGSVATSTTLSGGTNGGSRSPKFRRCGSTWRRVAGLQTPCRVFRSPPRIYRPNVTRTLQPCNPREGRQWPRLEVERAELQPTVDDETGDRPYHGPEPQICRTHTQALVGEGCPACYREWNE